MAQKTSINIKPCNIGSSEAHNRRTAEYLANIRKKKFYIRTDLMAGNETWVSPDFGEATLTDRYNQIAAMVKEKTGRAMQTKDRERVNKKTGKVTIVRGSTPLKEGVVVIKDDTTMEQLQRFCEVCRERWGVTALQVFIHRDEGHYGIPGDNATWKPNLHAHIVWDWMNHDTGKSCKLKEQDMSEMQTVLAECLEMERGTSKEVTGKEHLERTDFIIAKQKQEAEQAKAARKAAIAAKEEAEAELIFVENENKAKEQYRLSLDREIAEREQQLKDERKAKVDSILDSVGSLVGVGKSAAVGKENAKLKAENERIRKAFAEAVKDKAELPRLQGAKPVQSDLGDSFRRVRHYLDQGRRVLFSGTPCQVDGLYHFLGEHPERLLTCDVVCSGVSSPGVWGQLVRSMAYIKRQPPVDVCFCGKLPGEKDRRFRVRFAGGAQYDAPFGKSDFGRGLRQRLFLRPSCHRCPYTSTDRPADLTLGIYRDPPKDFHPEVPRYSISLLLVNSAKGAHYFDTLPLRREKLTLDQAVACAGALSAPQEASGSREDFFAAFCQQPFQQVRNRFLSASPLPQPLERLRQLLKHPKEK